MSLLSDIAYHLQNAGLGTVGVDIFYSYAPGDINTGIFVLDYGGPEPDPDIPTKHPLFQIFVRGADYDTGKAKLDQVRALLHQVKNTNIGSFFFYYILAITEGGHIGRSEAGHDEFTQNYKTLTR